MKDSIKGLTLFAIVVSGIGFFTENAFAQERERIVRTVSSRPINQPEPATKDTQQPAVRPPLMQDIRVQRGADAAYEPPSLVKKTVSTTALTSSIAASRSAYNPIVTSAMQKAIFQRLGIPYRYGSSGPNRYDCSGFVWAVFADAGIEFMRQSARSLWSISEPVFGDDRFKFGTLVFLNGLGHIGIVADENGFFHASSSKGITYSPFKGYWENRIVGFRRLNPIALTASETTTKPDNSRPETGESQK